MGHGKETPRQKMIGMMYLVLTAMLALNVSADILDAFVLVDKGLVKTTTNFVAKNESTYNVFEIQMEKSPTKVKEWRDKAFSVKDMADQLAYDIQELKVKIIQLCDGKDAPALTPAEWLIGEKKEKKPTFDIDNALIEAKDNLDKPGQIMIVVDKEGEKLKQKINDFRDHLVSLTADTAIQRTIKKGLDTSAPPTRKDGITPSWESSLFDHIPAVAVITILSKLQGDVRNAEADILQNLLSAIGASDTRVNKMEAIVTSKSSYVLKGNEYEARIILAAYDSLQKPEIFVGPYKRTSTGGYEMISDVKPLPYDAKGKAIYKSAPGVGNYTLQGLLRMTGPEGFINYPFSSEYQVGEASAVISATKMNVFYIGVDNPVSLTVSGVPSDKISASMTNGQLIRSGGDWIAKPQTAGTPAIVTVSANINGQTRVMGTMNFRVKSVPNPVAKVAGKIGGRIDRETLASQMIVQAEMENFDFDLKFTVTEFTVSANVKGFTQNKPVKGARIADDQKALIRSLTKGTKVYFDDIKAVGPDGKPRELSTVGFTID